MNIPTPAVNIGKLKKELIIYLHVLWQHHFSSVPNFVDSNPHVMEWTCMA